MQLGVDRHRAQARVPAGEQQFHILRAVLHHQRHAVVRREELGEVHAARACCRVYRSKILCALGRSVKQLVDMVSELHKQGVQFKSLTDAIDTGTPSGRFFFHVMTTHQVALRLMAKYKLSLYDANIVAAAGLSGCEILYPDPHAKARRSALVGIP